MPILETGDSLSESGSETPLGVGSFKGSKKKNQFKEKRHESIDESEEEVIPNRTLRSPAKNKMV